MQRFGREENWIKDWLGSDKFGDPLLFNLDIYQNIEGDTGGREGFWILDKRRAGGGIVISVAIHILDLLRYWLDDDFVEVYARGRLDPPFTHGDESTVAATLTTRRGVMGTLNCSYTTKRCPYSQRTMLFGTHGTLYQHMDQPVAAVQACGTHGTAITWWGKIDGHWQPPVASVTIRQQHGFDWFVLKEPFPYLSAGPSNRKHLDVVREELFEEIYQIEIQDPA